MVGSDGEVVRLVGTLTDVTEIQDRRRTAAARRRARQPHRPAEPQLFLDRLETVLALAKADPAIRATVMVIDLDRFKQVNDSVGMAVGDSILLTISRRLGRLLKPQDSLARLAGDQFALMLLSVREVGQIITFAETLRKALRTPITFNDRETVPHRLDRPRARATAQVPKSDEFLKDAELAMYHAKRVGGDRIEVFKPAMRARKMDRLTLESELRRAIERDEITILYQPIVHLEDRSVAGFEALARWDHPKLGRRSPAEFISIAEETGLIVDLGMFMLERTARQLAHVAARYTACRCRCLRRVNVSSRQLLRQDLIQDLRTVLGRSPVARGSLKLEITESLVMENPEQIAGILQRFERTGRRTFARRFRHRPFVAGLSAAFPVRLASRSISRSCGHSNKDKRPVLLRTIINMAQDLGMEAIAEGVESDAGAEEIYEMGCSLAQGFLFGEPMSAEQARQMIAPEKIAAAR